MADSAGSHVHEVVATHCGHGTRVSLQRGRLPDMASLETIDLLLERRNALGQVQDLAELILHLGDHVDVHLILVVLEEDIAGALVYPCPDLPGGDHVEKQLLDLGCPHLLHADLSCDLCQGQGKVRLGESLQLVPLQRLYDLLDEANVSISLDLLGLLLNSPLQRGEVALLEGLCNVEYIAGALCISHHDVRGVDRQLLQLAVALQRHQDILFEGVRLSACSACAYFFMPILMSAP
eukprot:CAMPEP_0175787450 /NCGR_PEP_ID=MMETSP0097-20121207/80358_1 /TAXON_ID=311494 /ORGANISM="Alexandrium monilatum, Strain CCMP3105" /LENGTH=235 /DNA_ID=CAMNT_0017098409 /DNA_START=72 /DNA_END=780 /DNA_ORIENTATION=-